MSDFYSDQGAFLIKLLHSADVPEFVKSGEYSTDLSVSSLPSSAFADPDNKTFPMHTPADVYVSSAYFYGKSAELDPTIESNLSKAAAIFGVTEDVAKVRELAENYRAANQKQAASVQNWTFETDSGVFNGTGPEQLQKAASHFLEEYASFSFEERTQIADGLLKCASDLGVDLDDEISKFAKQGKCNAELLEAELRSRTLLIGSHSKKAELTRALKGIGSFDLSQEDMEKTAEFINDFDQENGLTSLYGRKISDPHRAVWNESFVDHCDRTGTTKIGEYVHRNTKLAGKLASPETRSVLKELVGADSISGLAQLSEDKASIANTILL